MVDLSILDQESFNGSSAPTNELNRHLHFKRRISTAVAGDQIIDPRFRCNLLTGVAGIGKTSTIENLALIWGRDPTCFDMEDFGFRYVFLFSCRKLNEYRNRSLSFEQLFECEFNIQLKSLRNIDGQEVLIIVDGIDEIESLVSILNGDEVDDVYKIFHEIVQEQSSILPGHSNLLAGRPHVIPILKRFQQQTGPMRIVQILGFDSTSITQYVNKFCHDNQVMVNRILGRIEDSPSVKAMASIPQLLSSICSIYSWEITDLHLEKKTDLFVWAFLSFLKHQFPQFSGLLPDTLMSQKAVKKFVSAIAKISYDLIADNRILFEENELKELSTSDPMLKKLLDAFVLRVDSSSPSNYQFVHLIVQEFFAAVHCYVAGIEFQSLMKRELYQIAEFFAGFASADQKCSETNEDIVAHFIRNVPPRFRRSFRKTLSKYAKPSVLSLAQELFQLMEGWKISFDVFCSIFYELFNVGDVVPKCINFAGHADIILSHSSSLQVVRLNHFLTSLLTQDEHGHGPSALDDVIVTINDTDFSSSVECFTLLQLLGSFKEVSFVKCSFDTDALKCFCNFPFCSFLQSVCFDRCSIPKEAISCLSHCIPKIHRFSLVGIKLNLKMIEIIVQRIIECGYSSEFQLNELVLRNCELDDFCIEALFKAVHLIETLNLSENEINSVRIDLLFKSVSFRKQCEPGRFKLRTLILRNCSQSHIARRLRSYSTSNVQGDIPYLIIE